MDEWRSQYPGVVITRTEKGDREYAQTFSGEANKLLYELKNLMGFRKLGQLKMTRLFMDGTVITAMSVFGHDFLNIDVSRSRIEEVEIDEECTITLINLPEKIPPMRHPGVILEDEIEGQDYIKTYYTVDLSKCKKCNPESEWTFNFEFTDPPDYPYYDETPKDHCIVSTDRSCSAAIIDRGRDSGGDYIRWKAYTESFNLTRSGYGFVYILVSIVDEDGNTICSATQVVEVDCCIKGGYESPEMWWKVWERASCPGGFSIEGLCAVEDEINSTTLGLYMSWYDGIFYALPEVGGCPPYDWKSSGYGHFVLRNELGTETTFMLNEGETIACSSPTNLIVTDRCGNFDMVHIAPCCETAAPVSLGYTSLLMSCGTSQTFLAEGGCGPYQWTLTGGGVLDAVGNTAIYHAPATNPNCANNPTITVIDCCGNTAQVALAVNCYTGQAAALCYIAFEHGPCRCVPAGCSQGSCCSTHYVVTQWNCDGTIFSYCDTGWSACNPAVFSVEVDCSTFPPNNPCYTNYTGGCGTAQCGGCPGGQNDCNTLVDSRTTAMKNQGCCPLNPFTGLPY